MAPRLTGPPPSILDTKTSHVVITTPSPDRTNPEPHPSPREVELPPSPPFESDDDSDNSPPRPVLPKRPESDSTLSVRPIIHQLPLRPHAQSQIPSPTSPRPYTSPSMPPMQRAHSSPGIDSTGRFITVPFSQHRRPSSPLSSGRRRSPLRSAVEEIYPVSWSGLNIEPNIPEHAELNLSPSLHDNDFPMAHYSATLPRSRRRTPQSALHPSASAPTLYASARAASPSTRTGTLSPSARYFANEPYPGSSFSFSSMSASSMPSTPSSLRSRSPSISSLETIEDTPDEEEAARRAEEEDANLQDDGDRSRRRSSLELRASSLKSNKERKRWSVCGGERRADFSLEPIEE